MLEQECESSREMTSHSTEQFSKWKAEGYECKMRGHPSSRSRGLGKGLKGKTKVCDEKNTATDCRGASSMKGKLK